MERGSARRSQTDLMRGPRSSRSSGSSRSGRPAHAVPSRSMSAAAFAMLGVALGLDCPFSAQLYRHRKCSPPMIPHGRLEEADDAPPRALRLDTFPRQGRDSAQAHEGLAQREDVRGDRHACDAAAEGPAQELAGRARHRLPPQALREDVGTALVRPTPATDHGVAVKRIPVPRLPGLLQFGASSARDCLRAVNRRLPSVRSQSASIASISVRMAASRFMPRWVSQTILPRVSSGSGTRVR